MKTVFFILVMAYSVLVAHSQTADDLKKKAVFMRYCDLVNDAAKYDQKLVKVRVNYFVGFEGSVMLDSGCDDNKKRSWVEFGDSFKKDTEPKVLKQFDQLTDAKPVTGKDGGITYPSKQVEVLWVGRFVSTKPSQTINGRTFSFGFGHMNAYDYEFTVMSIESVEGLPKK